MNNIRSEDEKANTISKDILPQGRYETEGAIWDTIKINREAHVDHLNRTIAMPFKGTKLREMCEERGWIKQEISESYYGSMVHFLPSIPSKKVVAYQQLFEFYVFLPKRLYPLVNLLRTLWTIFPSNRILRRVLSILTHLFRRICKMGL